MGQYGAIIGGGVGAIIGSVVPGLGTSLGWMIGSAIGGAYSASQQVLPGPKIGEVQQQTSQEGGVRPIVFGRSHPIAGNVIADGGPKIVTRRESQGKGGPKVETESAYRTYAVGFCEGPSQLLQAWRNGVLVYDAEDPSMAAENAKFLEYATWFTGGFDQGPSPALEEVFGAGQAPYFRGTSYLALHNEDVTDLRGAWSQWHVRVFRGAAKSYTSTPYPAITSEGLRQNTEITGGLIRGEGQETFDSDALSQVVQLTGGRLREPLQIIEEGDALDQTVLITGGRLRQVFVETTSVEGLAQTTSLTGGRKRVALITQTQQPDLLEQNTILTGGRKYVP